MGASRRVRPVGRAVLATSFYCDEWPALCPRLVSKGGTEWYQYRGGGRPGPVIGALRGRTDLMLLIRAEAGYCSCVSTCRL